MQVSNNGIDYRIVDGGTKIIDLLPAKVYEIKFHQMFGMWLSERKELDVGDFKIYGTTNSRIEKIFKTFFMRNKNLGILLSGDKGMGKSVFMRKASMVAVGKGLPVIVVNQNYPGLANFIGKIDQECVVLFDEFEKNFLKDGEKDGDEQGGQTQFLSLFDGTDNGKKLFIIAINDSDKLSEFFINRPGRFYYHFKFSYLGEDEVRQYATDNLHLSDSSVNSKTIDKLVTIAKFHNINYDILSSIVVELNNGYSLKETINDLNIDIDENQKYYDFETYVEGIKLTGSAWARSDDENESVYLKCDDSRQNNLEIYYDMTSVKYDKELNAYVVDEDNIDCIYLQKNFGRFTSDNSNEIVIDKLILRPHKWDNASALNYLI